uniref:Peptidase S8/S53 domain-containing protein n=1 Tax=Aegilops tauschii subsp. strangulata TaxID=200361 RepID=A0A453J709_AEGTS
RVRAMRTLVLVPVLLLLLGACHGQQPEQRKNYVVHLEPRDDEGSAAVPVEDWHRSFLPEAAPTSAGDGGADAGPRIIYSYSHVLTGFAARLSDAEAEALRGRAGCIRLYPEVFLPLATTHSPGFLGLQTGKDGFWSRSGFGRGVVIGLVDTGILPSHPSFGDAGMPPPPKKWKGACEFKAIAGAGGCNNKVIGARAFGSAAVNDTAPPVDDAGHGTHTASTAAGNFVENADVRGNAHGTASGMAPHAHLAIYKVCSRSRCSIMDVIAGLDAAVKDGVDVISMSIDVSDGAQFNYDLVAVATYKAIERGIFVSAAAGNAGPAAGSVSNCAPWILTVAAGTTDRAIRTTVKLGNGQEFDGERQGGALREPRLQGARRAGADREGVQRRRHDPHEQAGGGVHHLRQRARAAGVARQQHRRLEDHRLLQVHSQPHGEHHVQGHGAGHLPRPDGGLLLLPRAEQGQPGHPEAGHQRAGDEHPRGVGAERDAPGVRRRREPGLLHGVRHVHVHPAPERHRRRHQEPAPELVPGGHQVGAHDLLGPRGQGRRAGQGRAVPAGELLHHGRRVREPVARRGPGPGLRPLAQRLHPVPVRAGLRRRRREGDRAPPRGLRQAEAHHGGGAQLPVAGGEAAVAADHRPPHREERGQGELRVHGRGGHAQGGVGHGAPAHAAVLQGGREAELHGDGAVGREAAGRRRRRGEPQVGLPGARGAEPHRGAAGQGGRL